MSPRTAEQTPERPSNEHAVPLHTEVENRFLTYALSTIVSRSLPDARDGLKPVQRRILYAMDRLGLSADAKHRKSAAVVGEVLGKYHPHGDQAAYDAMVRLAQDFSLRYPLVDGSGNFGSVDGDNAAAMRYTEARLSKIAGELLADLPKETVPFRDNYDATLLEPVVLPSRIPQLLINGASGIAVGMSCSFPPHHLGETVDACLALIENPNADVKNLMKSLKGPDFPTGGRLVAARAEIAEIYRTGQGSFRVRGEYEVEGRGRGRSSIVITSIPYTINKAKLLEKIYALIQEKKLPQVSEARDESTAEIRIVLDLKADVSPDVVMAYLYKHTDLEASFPANFTALKPNGEPERMGLPALLRHFLDFRLDVVTKRIRHEIRLLDERLHLLEAFEKIHKDLDKAIKIIRSSKTREEARTRLMKGFLLDQIQADAILERRLHTLVEMEVEKIKKERKEKREEKERLEKILSTEKARWGEVARELRDIRGIYADKRRTKLGKVEEVEFTADDFVIHEPCTVIISRNGWVRRVKTVGETLRFKEGDDLLTTVPGNTRDPVAFFTSAGKVYVVKALDLPSGSGFGEALGHLFKLGDGERVVGAMNGAPTAPGERPEQGDLFAKRTSTREFLLATRQGAGFRTESLDVSEETTRAGRKLMNVKPGDGLAAVVPVAGGEIVLGLRDGRCLRIPVGEAPVLAGAGTGVKLVNAKGSEVVSAVTGGKKETIEIVPEEGPAKQVRIADLTPHHRGATGQKITRSIRDLRHPAGAEGSSS